MFDCPRCGRPVPMVWGAEDHRCPHCHVIILPREPVPATRRLVGSGVRDLLAHPVRWWRLWLPLGLAYDALLLGLYFSGGDLGRLVASCAGSGAAVTPSLNLLSGVLALLGGGYALYFLGWTLTAGVRLDVPRDRAWWANAIQGSLVLALVFLLGTLLLVPLVAFLAWYHLAPVALAAGAKPLAALDRSRAAARAAPRTWPWAVVGFALVAEAALVGASCAGGGLTSLAAQGLVWWLLAPVLPVVSVSVWRRVEERDAVSSGGS